MVECFGIGPAGVVRGEVYWAAKRYRLQFNREGLLIWRVEQAYRRFPSMAEAGLDARRFGAAYSTPVYPDVRHRSPASEDEMAQVTAHELAMLMAEREA